MNFKTHSLGALAFSLFLSFSGEVSCQTDQEGVADQFVTGTGTAKTRKCKKDGNPSTRASYDEAVNKARLSAIRTWAAEKSIAVANLFDSAEQDLLADLDRYLLNPFVDSECDGKQFYISYRAQVNKSALRIALINAGLKKLGGSPSMVTAVFATRYVALNKSYDEKRTAVEESKEFTEAEQSAQVGAGNVSATSMSTTRNVHSTGGSTEQKADVVEWAVKSSADVDAAFTQVFTSFGYQPLPSAAINRRVPSFDVGAFMEEVAYGDGTSESAKSDMFAALESSGMTPPNLPVLAIGTMDVGAPSKDPASGMTRVYVSVKAQVFRNNGWAYAAVASVAPEQYSGIGPTQIEAEKNALKLASDSAAMEIVLQLVANGVR
jgi:hypothetical protein